MRVLVAAVGRAKAGPERTLFDDYVARLTWPLDLVEVREKRPFSGDKLRNSEAALLLNALPDGAVVVALDEAGVAMASEAFAERLARWRDAGADTLAFLIGGADGQGKTVLERAELVLSLGPMTWPHQLARVLLAEQLYRAGCILSGHPYHRG